MLCSSLQFIVKQNKKQKFKILRACLTGTFKNSFQFLKIKKYICLESVFLTSILKTKKQNISFKNRKPKTDLRCFLFFVLENK